jgi:hypothetical protein
MFAERVVIVEDVIPEPGKVLGGIISAVPLTEAAPEVIVGSWIMFSKLSEMFRRDAVGVGDIKGQMDDKVPFDIYNIIGVLSEVPYNCPNGLGMAWPLLLSTAKKPVVGSFSGS